MKSRSEQIHVNFNIFRPHYCTQKSSDKLPWSLLAHLLCAKSISPYFPSMVAILGCDSHSQAGLEEVTQHTFYLYFSAENTTKQNQN